MQIKILLIDYNEENSARTSKALCKQGYKVKQSSTVSNALDLCKTFQPDLIVLDTYNSEENSLSSIKTIFSQKGLELIHIIIITAKSDIFEKIDVFNTGAVDCITKPYYIEELFIRINVQAKLLEAMNKLKYQNEHLEQIVDERTRQLKKALKEKEILRSEIHHRVFNNLQIIKSLLFLEKSIYPNRTSIELTADFSNHIEILAQLHHLSYAADDIMEIQLFPLISTFNQIISKQDYSQKINVILNESAPCINLNLAIPLCSILYELIGKCAFYNQCGDDTRDISIEMTCSGNIYTVHICDSCSRLEEYVNYYDETDPNTTMLSVFLKQLNAEFKCDYKDGTRFSIVFADEKMSTVNNI